jgi:hypothetical protein
MSRLSRNVALFGVIAILCYSCVPVRQKKATPVITGGCLGVGGDERDRTVDLCVANASLSQLSYIPKMLIAIFC